MSASRDIAAQLDLALRYRCDLGALSEPLRGRFLQLGPDAALEAYIERAEASRPGRFVTGCHRLLRSYFSDFDVNGMLGIYPMHVLSTEQWRFLLEAAGTGPHDEPRGRLLDVGAGSGDVTVQLAPLFERVVTTELSRSMAYRLRRRGFSVHRTDVAVGGVPDGPYDVVSCLNVLDRCASPLSLLGSVRAGLKNGGLLILALVLPYRPFVYEGPSSVDPTERLPLDDLPWEAAVNGLCAQVLAPLALEVVAVSRAPYLSGGDSGRAIYELDDAIVLCRAAGDVALV